MCIQHGGSSGASDMGTLLLTPVYKFMGQMLVDALGLESLEPEQEAHLPIGKEESGGCGEGTVHIMHLNLFCSWKVWENCKTNRKRDFPKGVFLSLSHYDCFE